MNPIETLAVPTGSAHDIIVAPDPRLRLSANQVKDPGPEERVMIDVMISTMNASEGIGLAATQLGFDKRIIVMDVDPIGAFDDGNPNTIKHGKFEMINPVIVSKSGKTNWQEGCLSVPGFKETIVRDSVIDVTYLDRDGQQKQVKAAGLLSACIQHEIDHLNGVLFIDHMSPLKKDIIVRKLKKFRKNGVMIVKKSVGTTF